jgi:hypothetical protein
MKEITMLNNEDGSIIIISLVVLFLLTMLGTWASNTATVELQIASSEKAQKIVFYAADAGIEAGRAALGRLKNDDRGNWDKLLQGAELVGHTGISTLDGVIDEGAGNDRRVGPATFTLTVRDNNDLDGDNQVDSDNILILTSTATYGDAVARIEAHLRFGGGGGDEYDQEHYDAWSTGVAD